MKYTALIVDNKDGKGDITYKEVAKTPLKRGDVFIQVMYSGINYKDLLATDPSSRVVREYPMVPGIDFAGRVVESQSSDFKEGELVFLTGRGYGTDKFGGFQEFITVNDEDLLHIPENLTPKEVMLYGTAGLTAAMSVEAVTSSGGLPSLSKFLITGGTGGVASHAILMLKKLGFSVTASTRNPFNDAYLKRLGADEVLSFSSFLEKRKPLSKEKYQGVVDATGGAAVGNLLTELNYGGVLALSGNLSGASFESTVFPFILRGVTLTGIDSVKVTMERKKTLFEKVAKDYKSENLINVLGKEISFNALKDELLHGSKGEGRVLIHFEEKEI